MRSEECRCDCHRTQDGMETRHVGPCCIKCHFCSLKIPVSSISEHKKRCALSVLATELKFFEENRMWWFEKYAGKFALVRGRTSHGFFDTYEQAIQSGYLLGGLVFNAPFLVKEVQMRDRVFYMQDRIVIDLFDGIQNDYVI